VFEATSVDYNKDSEEAYTFFKIVQNKLHYAIYIKIKQKNKSPQFRAFFNVCSF
jgi:hypothetical protein